MKIVKMRCTGCGSTLTFLNQALDVCREKTCERCRIRLTVVSSEGEIGSLLMPPRERRVLTERETNEARRILVEAFG